MKVFLNKSFANYMLHSCLRFFMVAILNEIFSFTTISNKYGLGNATGFMYLLCNSNLNSLIVSCCFPVDFSGFLGLALSFRM